ncbi:MAG: hypothetical protein K6E76_02315 [Patescibacteria group bacterium]|nr:hypothetical protein [Patescibacteria group bacterium]
MPGIAACPSEAKTPDQDNAWIPRLVARVDHAVMAQLFRAVNALLRL